MNNGQDKPIQTPPELDPARTNLATSETKGCMKLDAPRMTVEVDCHIYIYIYIYSFISLFIYLSMYLFIYVFIYLFIHSFIHSFIYLFNCFKLFIYVVCVYII